MCPAIFLKLCAFRCNFLQSTYKIILSSSTIRLQFSWYSSSIFVSFLQRCFQIQRLSQNWHSLALDGLVKPSIGIPTKCTLGFKLRVSNVGSPACNNNVWVIKEWVTIRLLRLTAQNYVRSHWVAYYDVKYNELNEVFTVFSNLFET